MVLIKVGDFRPSCVPKNKVAVTQTKRFLQREGVGYFGTLWLCEWRPRTCLHIVQNQSKLGTWDRVVFQKNKQDSM